MSDSWSTISYVVCGAALLLSLGELLLLGWFAQAMLSRSPQLAERAIAGAALVLGVAQAAAPAWLLWRTSQGGFGMWGAGLGVVCAGVTGLLGSATMVGLGAASQP